ncbi:MAG TPA: outer membrane beta-barrel protein [Gallionellaceae bacterium]
MKKFVTGVMLLAAISAPAFAANPGGYAAIDLGSATFSGATFGGTGGNLTFPNPGSFHISGGYHFDQNVGVEVGLAGIGDSTINSGFITETLKSSAFYVAAVGSLPLSSQFDLFGKLGLASTKIDYTSNFFVPASASKGNVMFGLGGQYNFSQQFGLRVQYENFGKVEFPAGTIFTNKPVSVGLSTFTVGAVFSF